MASQNNIDFFNNLSSRCNYVDKEFITTFYKSFIRLILDELNINGEFVLPEFGSFRITKHKERRIRDVNTGELKTIPAIKTIKFEPNKKLKFYFRHK